MASHEITEALLEMHFYRPLFDLFEATYGQRVLRVLKPSQNKEAFLGFDLAWVRTQPGAPLAGVQQNLQEFVHTGTSVATVFLGYFLQFKVVDEVQRKSKSMPSGFKPPYFRVELSMHPNEQTGISQHETLLRLRALPNTDVSYACPMLFDETELHRPPTLDDLRIVPVATAPQGYASNERHFIAFQDVDAQPVWCSEPVAGRAVHPRDWVATLRPLDAEHLDAWLRAIRNALSGERDWRGKRLLYALTIVALGEAS